MCRPCRAEYKVAHYRANKARYVRQAGIRKRALAAERTTVLVAYLKGNPCQDCGEPDPLVLEFDHLHSKTFNISQGLRDRPWQDVLKEMEKCEVVCANCHRRRTARRLGSLRALRVDSAADRL